MDRNEESVLKGLTSQSIGEIQATDFRDRTIAAKSQDLRYVPAEGAIIE
jgi:hypothetical protein